MQRRKFDFIDALRGLAILGVFVCHLSDHLPGLPASLGRVLLQGGIGVQLFFIASALTLFLSLDARRADESRPILNFFIRRFFRIVPLFTLAVLFYALCFGGNSFDARVPSALSRGSFLSTLTFTNGWSPWWINQIVPGGWSIAVEMNFYLMVPFLHRRLRSLGASIAATAIVFLLGAAASRGAWILLEPRLGPEGRPMLEAFVHYWLPGQLYRFFMGFTLYFLIRRSLPGSGSEGAPQPAHGRSLELLVGSVLLLGAAFAIGPRAAVSKPLVTLALLLFAWSLALHPPRLLVNRWMCFLGKVSFSAYVVHVAVLRALEAAVHGTHLPVDRIPWPIASFAYFVVALGATVGLSTLTYHGIEIPGLLLGKRLIEAVKSAHAPTVSVAGPQGPG
jgi:peptidoglycan/LPS O-acetylase OafA/YrhL